jgi:hypothetical protein
LEAGIPAFLPVGCRKYLEQGFSVGSWNQVGESTSIERLGERRILASFLLLFNFLSATSVSQV